MTHPSRSSSRKFWADAFRSLGILLLIVGAVYVLGRPPKSDEKRLRPVTTSDQIGLFVQVQPGAPVPRSSPAGWTPTVAQYQPQPDRLRIGWNIPHSRYVEYAAYAEPRSDAIRELVGDGAEQGADVQAGGATWQVFRKDGATSLVRVVPAAVPVTVVLGTLRTNAPLADLETLAGVVR